MKQQDYAMRYLGEKFIGDLLGSKVIGRLLDRTGELKARHSTSWKTWVMVPRKAVFYSNGVFTVAIVAPSVTFDPDRIYMGVSKKCDKDPINLEVGERIALVRAIKAFLVGERARLHEQTE